jgi:hypothetical protein
VEDPLDVVVYGDVGAATMTPDLSRLRRIGAGRGADPACPGGSRSGDACGIGSG